MKQIKKQAKPDTLKEERGQKGQFRSSKFFKSMERVAKTDAEKIAKRKLDKESKTHIPIPNLSGTSGKKFKL